jgi:hypothetical protein
LGFGFTEKFGGFPGLGNVGVFEEKVVEKDHHNENDPGAGRNQGGEFEGQTGSLAKGHGSIPGLVFYLEL